MKIVSIDLSVHPDSNDVKLSNNITWFLVEILFVPLLKSCWDVDGV